jgi:hypothetical protein
VEVRRWRQAEQAQTDFVAIVKNEDAVGFGGDVGRATQQRKDRGEVSVVQMSGLGMVVMVY